MITLETMSGASWSHDKSITWVIKTADSLYFFQYYKKEESNLFTIIVWNCHYLSSLSTDPGRISSSLPGRPSRPGSESAAASCTSRRSVEEQGGWGVVGWWVKERRAEFRSAARRGADAKNNCRWRRWRFIFIELFKWWRVNVCVSTEISTRAAAVALETLKE